MTYSIRFDDYKNISSTFGTTARWRVILSPAVSIFFFTTLLLVVWIIPTKKIKKLSLQRKILAGIILWLLILIITISVMVGVLLLQIYIFDFFKK